MFRLIALVKLLFVSLPNLTNIYTFIVQSNPLNRTTLGPSQIGPIKRVVLLSEENKFLRISLLLLLAGKKGHTDNCVCFTLWFGKTQKLIK